MTPEQFAYWLKGYVEIDGAAPDTIRWEIIKDHLATVFNKVTPNRSPRYAPNPNPNPLQTPKIDWPPMHPSTEPGTPGYLAPAFIC